MKYILFFFIILSLPAATRQDDDRLDLTRQVKLKERPEGISARGGMAGSTHGSPFVNPLRVTLLSLDAERYQIDDEATFEIRIDNTGKLPVIIPWSDDYDRVKPDRSFPPGYLEASIRLVGSGELGEIYFGSETIYGSSLVAGSLKRLEAGRSVYIRGKIQIAVFDGDLRARLFEKSPRALEMNIQFAYSEGEFTRPVISTNGLRFDLSPRRN
jgi:hypothetical protein